MIETLITEIEYDGDNATVDFVTTTFPFFGEGDLRVYLRDEATGDLDLQVLDTEYTVTGGEGTTGTVSMTVAPTSAQQIRIVRVTAPTQETDYQNQASIPHETLEHDFDRGVLRDQEMQRDLGRTLHFPLGDTITDGELPGAEARADGVLVFDSTGAPVVGDLSVLSPGSVVVGTPGQSLLPLTTLEAWRDTLVVVENAAGTEAIGVGALSARPAAATFGTGFWLDDDAWRLYYWDGAAWTEAGIGQFTNATLPATAALAAGRLLFDTDNGELLRDSGSAIAAIRTPFPRGHLSGLNLTRTTTTAVVSAGECRTGTSSDRSIRNAFNTSAFTKAINATWAAGTGNGGRAAGVSLAASTWYHLFLIRKKTGAIDFVFDTSVECVNGLADAVVIAAGFGAGTTYRRVGSVLTDGSSLIRNFVQHGDLFIWSILPGLAVNLVAQDHTAGTTLTLPHVPLGIRTLANVRARVVDMANQSLLRAGDAELGTAPALYTSPLASIDATISLTSQRLLTNTAQQVLYRVATDTSADILIEVDGYEDARGRWD